MEKTIFQGKSQKGTEFLIRYPGESDAKLMWEYINTLSKERTYVSYQGEEISLEDETKYLSLELERTANKKAVLLLVIIDGKIAGISDINMKIRIEQHVGLFGISLAKEFRGEGIGAKLMELVIEEATKNLPDLEIIMLSVFAENDLAKSMYEKFGFKEYGNLPKGIKRDSGYSDHVYMYKMVKETE